MPFKQTNNLSAPRLGYSLYDSERAGKPEADERTTAALLQSKTQGTRRRPSPADPRRPTYPDPSPCRAFASRPRTPMRQGSGTTAPPHSAAGRGLGPPLRHRSSPPPPLRAGTAPAPERPTDRPTAGRLPRRAPPAQRRGSATRREDSNAAAATAPRPAPTATAAPSSIRPSVLPAPAPLPETPGGRACAGRLPAALTVVGMAEAAGRGRERRRAGCQGPRARLSATPARSGFLRETRALSGVYSPVAAVGGAASGKGGRPPAESPDGSRAVPRSRRCRRAGL